MTEIARIKSLSKYFQHSTLYFYVLTDFEGVGIYGNSLFTEKINHAHPGIAGFSFTAIITEGSIARYRNALREIISKPARPVNVDLYHEFTPGSFTLVRWELQAFPGAGNTSECVQYVGVPVNLIKETQTATGDNKVSEQERYQAYEMSAQALWRMELEVAASINWPPDQIISHCRRYGYIAECNEHMAKLYGFAGCNEMTGTRFENIINLDNPKQVELLKNFVENGFTIRNVETEEHDVNGNRICFLSNMTGIVENGELKRVWGTQQDITDQKKAEEDRLRNELFYRNLIGDALDGILLTDINGIISFASPSVERILGYRAEELVQTHAFDYVHPDDYKEAMEAFENEVRMEPEIKYIDIRLRTKQGQWLYCNVRGHNMLYNPYVGRMAVYFHDDSRRKATEDKLRESEKRLRSLEKKKNDS